MKNSRKLEYTPACLLGIPPQKSKPAEKKRKEKERDIACRALLECIQRIKAERRSKPRDWERGYNSAITSLELFLDEIRRKEWAGVEGSAVNQKLTTGGIQQEQPQ